MLRNNLLSSINGLPSASWKPRTASGVVWRPESQEPWEQKTGVTAQALCVKLSVRQRKNKSSFPPHFCSILAFSGLDDAIHLWEGLLLYSVFLFKCQSLPGTPSQTHSEITFNQISGHGWLLISWIIILIIFGKLAPGR